MYAKARPDRPQGGRNHPAPAAAAKAPRMAGVRLFAGTCGVAAKMFARG